MSAVPPNAEVSRFTAWGWRHAEPLRQDIESYARKVGALAEWEKIET